MYTYSLPLKGFSILSFIILWLNLFWALGIVLANAWPCPPAWYRSTSAKSALPFMVNANCTTVGRRFNSHRRRAATPPPLLSRYACLIYAVRTVQCTTLYMIHNDPLASQDFSEIFSTVVFDQLQLHFVSYVIFNIYLTALWYHWNQPLG